MNIVVWIAQGLLALGFLTVGYGHAFNAAKMREMPRMEWIKAIPPALMTFIGAAEMAGGLGVLLPMVTGIWPWLTPIAAGLLAVVMLLAIFFHLQRREFAIIRGNVILLLLAAFVAWGRWGLV
jgi:hypothetical protein